MAASGDEAVVRLALARGHVTPDQASKALSLPGGALAALRRAVPAAPWDAL